MKLSKVITQLVNELAQEGDCEVELQDKDTNCHPDFHIVVETNGIENKPTIKLRTWPY
jgi:hypothetical protein